MAKIVRFFEDIAVTSSGIEIPRILGGIRHLVGGEIQQVVVNQTAGSATSLDIQIRYKTGNDDLDKLAYLYEAADISSGSFIDSGIDAPFSLQSKKVDGDLYLYLESDANCTLSIRLDVDINNVSGL
jgi:hypothetical protein